MSKNISTAIIILSFGLAILLGSFNLTENPPTWLDEGMIIQSAKNLADLGVYKIQVAPNTFVSPGFISTSYPVTFPIAMTFKLFGAGLFQARIVMYVFLLAALLMSLIFAGKCVDNRTAPFVALIMASFPPLYGNGKNVLGEVPGFFWLVCGLFVYHQLQSRKEISKWQYLACGVFFGLAVSAKPIFILLLPALMVSLLIGGFYRKHCRENKIFFIIGLATPIIFWSLVQFSGDSFFQVLRYYSNPHEVDLSVSFLSNIVSFFSQAQPMYCLAVYGIWLLWLVVRIRRRNGIFANEYCAIIFAGLVILAYFRNPGYYRYFFIAELISFLYLPWSLAGLAVWPAHKLFRGKGWIIARIVMIFIVVFQTYQLFFSSWIATHFWSDKTELIENAVSGLSRDKPVFVFRAAEITPFLKNANYYQYLSGTKSSHIGFDQLERLKRGDDLTVIASQSVLSSEPQYFTHYMIEKKFAGYVILARDKDSF